MSFKDFIDTTPVSNTQLRRWENAPAGALDGIASKLLAACPTFNPWIITGDYSLLYGFCTDAEREAFLHALTWDEKGWLMGDEDQ